MFSIRCDPAQLRTARTLLTQVVSRFRAMQRQLMYDMAMRARDEIVKRIPKIPSTQAYRKSFQVVEVKGLPANQVSYAVRVNPKARGIRMLEARSTVIYVRARSTFQRVSPGVQVLIDYSPWPVAMLPFTPKRQEAKLISRRVRKDEAEEIQRQREADRSEWRPRLEKSGHRELRKDRIKIPATLSAIPDVAFQGLRLEYGIGGERTKAHWRPGIRTIVSKGILGMIKRNQLSRYVGQASFVGWRRPPRTLASVLVSETKRYEAFEKRLGIKAGGR